MTTRSWHWSVEGTEYTSGSPGAMERPHDDEGVIEAEGAGEALDWLINKGPIWDGLDEEEEIRITIRPATDSEIIDQGLWTVEA